MFIFAERVTTQPIHVVSWGLQLMQISSPFQLLTTSMLCTFIVLAAYVSLNFWQIMQSSVLSETLGFLYYLHLTADFVLKMLELVVLSFHVQDS